MNTFCRVQGRAKPGRSRSRVQAVQQCRETPSSIYCKTCVGTTTGTGPPLVSVTVPVPVPVVSVTRPGPGGTVRVRGRWYTGGGGGGPSPSGAGCDGGGSGSGGGGGGDGRWWLSTVGHPTKIAPMPVHASARTGQPLCLCKKHTKSVTLDDMENCSERLVPKVARCAAPSRGISISSLQGRFDSMDAQCLLPGALLRPTRS